jgi:uncharacterized protein YhaN
MNDIHSIEERVKRLEKLLYVEQPLSPHDHTESVLKTDSQIEGIDLRIDTLESEVGDLESTVGDATYQIEQLEAVNISSDEMTNRIKYYLQIFLRNSLGLEVSFDDKR